MTWNTTEVREETAKVNEVRPTLRDRKSGRPLQYFLDLDNGLGLRIPGGHTRRHSEGAPEQYLPGRTVEVKFGGDNPSQLVRVLD